MKNGKKELQIGLVLTGIILGLAILSIFYLPYDYNAMDKTARSLAPALSHLFGTDSYGRDIFSRAVFGSRYTLLVALSTVGSCTVIASVLGLLSGYVGGLLDEIIMRIIDAISSFPDILIALMVVTVLNLGQFTIVAALCITFVPSFTRIVRTATLQYKNAEFVKNLRVFGVSDARILLVHIFPNTFPLLLSTIVIGLSNAILAEAAMSYLGLGIQPPIPSWGRMLQEAQTIVYTTPWAAVCPGIMIVVTIVGLNCIGEGLRKLYL